MSESSLELERREAGNGHVSREWIDLLEPAAALANQVAGTGFVPKAMQGNPAAIVAAILYGDELGLGPMQSLAKIAVIEGKPTLYAEAQRALILAAGHEIRPTESTATRVTYYGKRADTGAEASVTWTLDDAKRANLAGRPNWRTYPRQMLAARATAELARTLFADVIGGLAATEELEDVVEDRLVMPTDVVATETRTETVTRKRRGRPRKTPALEAPDGGEGTGGEGGDDATTAAPALPPLPDEPAEPLLEPTPEIPSADEPESGEPRGEPPADPDQLDIGADGVDESDGGLAIPSSPSDDAGEVVPDDETTIGSEPPADSAGASPADMADLMAPAEEKTPTPRMRTALDALVSKLRVTEVEVVSDEGESHTTTVLSVDQLWAAAATRRNVEVEVMIALLGGRDDDGVLHWSPLRDSLTRSEASDLISKLEDRARKWGVE